MMPITNQNAVTQALANTRLESLTLSTEVLELIKSALDGDATIDTTYILNLMRG